MRATITGRHVEVTPQLKGLIDKKLQKLERVLNDSAVSAQVILSRERHTHAVEVILHARGDHVLRGEAAGDEWAQAINGAFDKVDHQAHTIKGKWDDRRRQGGGSVDTTPTEPDEAV